jgi:integrase
MEAGGERRYVRPLI